MGLLGAMEYGIVSLLPTALVLALAIKTRRTLESVIAGAIFAFLIMDGTEFVDSLAAASLKVLQDEQIAWIILVCALYGVFIALLVRSGGAQAIGNLLLRSVKSKKGSLLITWLLGWVIFLDDYLNSLTVGTTMKAVTDRFKTSRAMLAYVVDSTAAPLCLLVPISSWGPILQAFWKKRSCALTEWALTSLLNQFPTCFIPLSRFLLFRLVIMGIVPRLGAMKVAEDLQSKRVTLAQWMMQ